MKSAFACSIALFIISQNAYSHIFTTLLGNSFIKGKISASKILSSSKVVIIEREMTFPLPAVRRIAACILCTGLCTKNPNPFPLGTEFGLSLSSADNRTRTCTVSQRHLKPSRLPIPPYPPAFIKTIWPSCF